MHFTLPCGKIRDMVEIVYNSTCVYQTAYHVIWCPKYRKRILTGGIAETLRLAINAICIEREWPILTLEIQQLWTFGASIPLNHSSRSSSSLVFSCSEFLSENVSGLPYLDYRCKNPMDAGCPSGSTSSRRFPGGLIFLEAR